MGFEHFPEREVFRLPNLPDGPHIFFGDIVGTKQDESIKNPITGSLFRIEKGPPSTPPKYDYDEAGVVLKGDITLEDETGQTVTLHTGDTFIVNRGSTITFSSSNYGIAFKAGSRWMSKI